jgi:photosystem II stability/assembly factor-like uncharacterized protein
MKMSKKMKQAITVAAIAGTMALSGTAFAATSGWKTQTLTTSGSGLNAMANDPADNNAVVVGDSGEIYTITDVEMDDMKASSWVSAAVPTVNSLNAVAAYANNSFVAVGDAGTILYSTDSGATWKSVAKVTDDMAGEKFLYVVASGGKVVAATATKLYYTASIHVGCWQLHLRIRRRFRSG